MGLQQEARTKEYGVFFCVDEVSLGQVELKPSQVEWIYRDLSYSEILAGRPGAWLVKKIFSICMQ